MPRHWDLGILLSIKVMLKCTIYGKLDPSVTHWDDRRGATRMTL
ncbi:MAG: hypothetical protein ACR5K5_06165 [Wolbachia sp.]